MMFQSTAELSRSADAALKIALQRALLAPPGSQFHYDQTNYLLLMRVIEHVAGKPFQDYLLHDVLGSALKLTVWGDARAKVASRAAMYTSLLGNGAEKAPNLFEYPAYLDAAAGLNSTISDMEQFAILLTSGRLLPQKQCEQMWRPASDRAGRTIDVTKAFDLKGFAAPAAGWFYADNSGGTYPRLFMAGGSATAILALPKQELCVIVLTNLQAKDDPTALAEMVAQHYFPRLKSML